MYISLEYNMYQYKYFTMQIYYIIKQGVYWLWRFWKLLFHEVKCVSVTGPQKPVRPVRPWPDQFWQLNFSKSSCNALKSPIPLSQSSLLIVAVFLVYLTAVHNMDLGKVWLTQRLNVTSSITSSITMSLINGSRDHPNYQDISVYHVT